MPPTIRRLGLPACLAALAGLPAVAAPPTSMDDVPLIEREVLFGNPERAGVQLSPDGTRISFLAPVDGVLNVWVAPLAAPEEAEPITADDDRGIRRYFWAENGTHLVYLQDRGGDENWRAYSVEIASRREVDLTPFEGVQARIAAVEEDVPNHILVDVNERSPQFHDTYRVDVRTGERELVFQNDGYASTIVDGDMEVRIGTRMNSDGSTTYERVAGREGAEEIMRVPSIDTLTTSINGFIGDSSRVYLSDSRDRDTGALYELDLATGERRLVYADDRTDIAGIIAHPVTDELEAVIVNYTKPEPVFFDSEVEADYRRLERVRDGLVGIADRSNDDRTWLVTYTQDDGPIAYYAYDRDDREARYLFTSQPALEDLPLATMHPEIIQARDGLELVSYLTLPVWTDADGDARPSEAVPMVLLVHGGPWARDTWGYNSLHQWLANRGYAVLSVNFRGSTGFGKSFIAAGNGEWADAMHTDLIDAVDWAIEAGIADPDRVAIMGGSYGGYATLAGLVFSPDVFACGVDIVGPSNLITLLESIPAYWQPIMEMFATRVADPRTPEGRRKLRDMSPLTHVDEIKKPLLIGQGANDPRVNLAESDQIVDAMQSRDIPVTYVVFPDEGHGFAKPENRIAFFAITEHFLAEHIGGRAEALAGVVADSSAQVRSLGELELEGVEVVEAPDPAAEATLIETVQYEDLSPEQQNNVDRILAGLEDAPDEMLPQIIRQLEQQRELVSDTDRPAVQYLIQEIEARMDD